MSNAGTRVARAESRPDVRATVAGASASRGDASGATSAPSALSWPRVRARESDGERFYTFIDGGTLTLTEEKQKCHTPRLLK